MATSIKSIPEGYHSVTPYLVVDGAAAAIAFYQSVFDAREALRMGAPGGRVGHAELIIGDSKIMLADESPDMGARGPKSIGGSPVSLHLYVPDVDGVVARALAARGEGGPPGQGPVLRRPVGHAGGSLRPPLARRDPRGGRAAG